MQQITLSSKTTEFITSMKMKDLPLKVHKLNSDSLGNSRSY